MVIRYGTYNTGENMMRDSEEDNVINYVNCYIQVFHDEPKLDMALP